LDAGNRVVFDRGNSYIMNKNTKAMTPIHERNVAFVFDLWMPKGKEGAIANVNANRYQALMEEDKGNEDFLMRNDLFN